MIRMRFMSVPSLQLRSGRTPRALSLTTIFDLAWGYTSDMVSR